MVVTYETKFIESIRFMASSLSNVVDNILEKLHKGKCKYCKKYVNAKDGSFVFNFSDCHKSYKKSL